VIRTQTAVKRALLLSLGSRIRYAFADLVILVKPFVCFDVCPVYVFEMSVLRAVFHQQDLTISFDDCSGNAL
jgi:NAD-dependent dihydropyrimidine dehydrogenase PreA subunit